MRNCTRDEGRSFEVGSQALISSHRMLLSSVRWPIACAMQHGLLLWIIFVRSTHFRRSRHVRFAPIASEPSHRSDSTRCANCRLMQCSKSAGRGRDASYLAPPAQSRTCGFPAYGSHLGSKRQAVAVCVPAPVTREPGAESSACFASPHSPWSTPFAPPTPLRLTPPRTAPQWGATLFAGFTATMAGSDFSCPCIIGYGSSPSRCGPSRSRNI
jgi:hypothetical protein